MRTFVLGLALGLTVACGASGLESMAIGTELMGKGLKAAKEAGELMSRERPQAAVVVMNRHLREIDEAIQTVKNDPMITERDKASVLLELQKYRSGHQQDLQKFRAYANMHSELSDR
jgi:hypothetical protein